MEKGYILCVDDQPAILDSLLTQLEIAVGESCEIETAESADEALELLDDLHERGAVVEMVISDEVMPGIKGSQLLEMVHQKYPDIIKVMLTGQAGLDSVAYAINNAGLDKYFMKPWEHNDLQLTIQNLLEKRRLTKKNARLTQELHTRYEELERTYQELSIAYQQLKDAQDQLIRSEKLSFIGQLSSSIAHEVKNQLNMIGFATLIQEAHPDDATIQKYTGYIMKAGENIYNLIDEMRRFAKKEQRRYKMLPMPVGEVLERLFHFIRMDPFLKKRTITTDFQPTPLVLLNEGKFGQVMINLLRNAAHATAEGTGTIALRVSADETHVLIEVQDDGCGIPEEQLEQIWEPFFTTKKEEGTGLGLDICQRIIHEHHGTITCTSRVGQGTTFTILLPVTDDKHDANDDKEF